MSDNLIDPMAEVTAMQKLAEALSDLESDARGRVLQWALGFYKVGSGSFTKGSPGGGGAAPAAGAGSVTPNGASGGFADLADLHAATNPSTEADKALVAAYWVQYGEGKSDFSSQEVNTALKNLGHPIKNITNAFDTLKGRKPAAVLQLKKSGSTRQARKTYRVTVAGKSAVEAMVQQQSA